ncbi:MAG: HypC/HybG/HupF family hydrogenase formation chaperone [Planctomycetes bacterium]|nr:HypC/HybG/HupF family hydrogenase formation chaperone [Planctomycetota bacterium]
MCLAIPLKIVEVEGQIGRVKLDATTREVGLQLLDDARPGDYVLVHAGFAIQKLDEQEAEETLRLWDEMARLELGQP